MGVAEQSNTALHTVRAQLEHAVMRRRLWGFEDSERRRYRDLCQQEATLLEAGGIVELSV